MCVCLRSHDCDWLQYVAFMTNMMHRNLPDKTVVGTFINLPIIIFTMHHSSGSAHGLSSIKILNSVQKCTVLGFSMVKT